MTGIEAVMKAVRAAAVVAALSNCHSAPGGDRVGATRRPDPPHVVTEATDHRGTLYVGASRDAVGWLLELDPTIRSGRLFDPLGPISLCQVIVDSTGRVSFSSPELSDGTAYRFAGRSSTGGPVDGVFEQVAARSGRLRQSFPTVLRPVRLRTEVPARNRPVSGIYANATYHQESGDLLGYDLVLLDGMDSVVVLTVHYSGGPDWPRMAQRAELRGDTLLVWTRYPVRGDTADTGVVSGDTLTFDRDYRMVKKATIEQFLAGVTRYRCP